MWAYGRGQTDTQTRVTTIHFASSTTHAKCNNIKNQSTAICLLQWLYPLTIYSTRALQHVATCGQSPYLHKPAIIIMTSFSLWRHSLMSWPRPALRTYITYACTDTLPHLTYEDYLYWSFGYNFLHMLFSRWSVPVASIMYLIHCTAKFCQINVIK